MLMPTTDIVTATLYVSLLRWSRWRDNNGHTHLTCNKRPSGPVSLTWFLPNIFLYQSMTKGCYMLNINAFWPVVHEKSLIEIGLVVLEKKIFLNISLYILLCKSLSPWCGAIHDPKDFIWTNFNLLAPRMLHATYQCIPAGGSWEEDFSRFIKIFLMLPLIGSQKGPDPLFKQIWIPIPQASFMPSLVEIGLVVLEKKIF